MVYFTSAKSHKWLLISSCTCFHLIFVPSKIIWSLFLYSQLSFPSFPSYIKWKYIINHVVSFSIFLIYGSVYNHSISTPIMIVLITSSFPFLLQQPWVYLWITSLTKSTLCFLMKTSVLHIWDSASGFLFLLLCFVFFYKPTAGSVTNEWRKPHQNGVRKPWRDSSHAPHHSFQHT